jgi:hypothetical protein
MPNRSDPVDLLRALAKRYRVRVTALNLYDPNVCTSGIDWRDALENRPPPLDYFRYQTKLNVAGRSVRIRSNDRFIAVDLRGGFAIDNPFSVNRPDRVMMLLTHPVRRIGAKQWRVFLEPGKGVPAQLDQHAMRRPIQSLNLGTDESLHVYRNGLTAYMRPDSIQRVVDAMAAAVTIADELAAVKKPASSSVEDYPKEFRSLVPLVEKWAKSDDEERADLLARVTRSCLEDLVRQVTPYFTAINRYLDSFGDGPMPESATALGTLAESASEAQILLRPKVNRVVRKRRLHPTAARRASRKRISRRG